MRSHTLNDHTAHLSGGPRDGETHPISLPTPRLLFAGNVEDRVRYVHADGTPGMAFPTVVYGRTRSFGSTVPVECRDHIYRYVETRPPLVPEEQSVA